MKKLIPLMLILALLLSACSQPAGGDTAQGTDAGDTGTEDTSASDTSTPDTSAPDTDATDTAPDYPEVGKNAYGAPRYTREDLPRFDGSTATAPLAAAVCAEILGESRESAGELITFSRTTNSYYNLLDGYADILIVSEGSAEVYAEREKRGFAWEQTPLALDAFVFVVNEDNPVDSITVEEARKIYSGQITNWSQLGGEDREIIPLQRNPEAGSQSLMEKLVMRGTPMLEPKKEYLADSMGELMEFVRGYDDSPGAIGYSVYYYAREMRAARGLKLLRVDGVEPEPSAIRSGQYPLTNPYYVVIPASAGADSPTRLIRDWLLSEGGQKLAAAEGYVSVADYPTADSGLPPEVGGRYYPDYTAELKPADDYGGLVPYAGLRLSDDWYVDTGCLYGLMTRDGRVVVDPVYSQVSVMGGVLVLTRGQEDGPRFAAAGLSGQWVTGYDYTGFSLSETGVSLFTDRDVTLMVADGSVAARLTPEDMGISRELFEGMFRNEEIFTSQWIGDKLSVTELYDEDTGEFYMQYYNLTTGKLETMDSNTWYTSTPGYPDETPPFENTYAVYDAARGFDAPYLWERWDNDGSVSRRTYYRQDGTVLSELTILGVGDFRVVTLTDGIVEKLELDRAEYYDLETGRLIFRTYLGYDGQ